MCKFCKDIGTDEKAILTHELDVGDGNSCEYQRKYREANLEKVSEKNRKWREAHKEEQKAYQHEWYLKNREKVLARQKAKAEEKETESDKN